MLLQKLNNRKGFTLVEMCIVLAMIGILAAIIIPNVISYREKAREEQTLIQMKSNIKQNIEAAKTNPTEQNKPKGGLKKL